MLIARCRQSLLDEPLSRARGEYRPPARRHHGPDARPRRHHRGNPLAAHVAVARQSRGMEWNGDLESMARTLVFDSLNHASVTFCVNGARENARQVREEISSEQWQRLNRLFHQMHSPQAQAQFRTSINDALAAVIDGIHLFKGVSDTTMIHGQGWQFIRLGRYLERAYATATLLEVHQPELCHAQGQEHSGYQYLEQVGLLRCCTSFEAYCQVYTADISPDRILEFLLLNRDFPHAIRYCVDGIRHAIESIQRTGGRRASGRADRRASAACTPCSATPPSAKSSPATPGAFLHAIREQCMRIHELIYRYYVHYSIQSALAI